MLELTEPERAEAREARVLRPVNYCLLKSRRAFDNRRPSTEKVQASNHIAASAKASVAKGANHPSTPTSGKTPSVRAPTITYSVKIRIRATIMRLASQARREGLATLLSPSTICSRQSSSSASAWPAFPRSLKLLHASSVQRNKKYRGHYDRGSETNLPQSAKSI